MISDPVPLSPDESDVGRWTQTTHEVTSTLLEYPDRDSNIWLRRFPSGSCSVASFAIASTLRQRYDELWTIEWCFTGEHSHTWLSKDAGLPSHVTIDSTLHQFSHLATTPFISAGPSPAISELFDGYAVYGVRVDRIAADWHHGQTREVYEWAFPRLGLSLAGAGLASTT